MAALTVSTVPLLADGFDGHHDWNGGWWIVMGLGMAVIWALVTIGAVRLVRSLGRPPHGSRGDSRPTGDHRAASGLGEIDTEEYQRERGIRLAAVLALGLLAWGSGIPSFEGIGLLVLGAVAAAVGRRVSRRPIGSLRAFPRPTAGSQAEVRPPCSAISGWDSSGSRPVFLARLGLVRRGP